jgi:uncharacterized membrane protein
MRRWLLLLLTAAASLGLLAGLAGALWHRDALTVTALGRTLELAAPRALLLVAALPWIWLGCGASLTDMSRAQLGVQAAGRSLLLCLLALALARPALPDDRQKVSAVVLVDVSDSVGDAQLAAAAARIEELRRLADAGGHELHVVPFAARPRVLKLPQDRGQPLPPLRDPAAASQGERQQAETDIQAALQLAYGLHAPGTIRRVLLISDGNQTEGDLLSEAQAARRRGVRLDHEAPLKDASADQEVLVRDLRLEGGESAEAEIKVGAPFTLLAEVYASAPQRVRATLYQDGAENPGDGRREVDLQPGRNLLRFRGEVRTPGYVSYKVQLSAPAPAPDDGPDGRKDAAPLRDRFADNNQALLSLLVKGRPRVLYIEGDLAQARYLSQALQRENIEVEARNPYGLPASARELARFDLVLLSDVSATLISQGQMAAIESYVRDHGGGFVMAGGENSFGSGGYQGTLIEKVLPVRFEQEKKRDQPSLALVLCIDRSGSMNGPKLELAKDAARATAEMLQPDDLIGVIAFDSQATPQVRLQRAQNRMRISTEISRLQASGGTAFLPPLQEAFQQLSAASAKIKHVIMLTDGQAEYDGVLSLIDQMVEQKITVTTVGVGNGADKSMLTSMAERGNGRFYYTPDPSSIPKIFTKETTQVARSALVEEAVRVTVQKRVEMLEGTGIESAPLLRGYVATKAKPMSETLLGTSNGEPLLVRWRLGLGQALAFTSDVKNRWAVDWLRWPGYPRFWAQLVRSSMRHDLRTRGGGYDLCATVLPPRAHVTVDAVASDDRFVSGLHTTLEVIAPRPDGVPPGTGGAGAAASGTKVAAVPMPQSAPGRYEAEVTLPRRGAYLLRAVHRSQGEDGPVVAESWGSVALSYPREYLALPPDLALLAAASQTAGGKQIQAAAEVLDPGGERVRFLRPLWPYLLGLGVLLLLLDVALRRVRLFGYRPLSL